MSGKAQIVEPNLLWEHYLCTKRKEGVASTSKTEGNQGWDNGNSEPTKMGDKWIVDKGGKYVKTEAKGIVVTKG